MSKYSKTGYKSKQGGPASTQGGFIALISTLILTSALMMLMFSSNTSSFFSRFDALGSENKRVSLGLSESCSNAAILKLAQNYDYTGDEDIPIGDGTCHVESINPTPNMDSGSEVSETAIIKTKSQYPDPNGSWSTNSITVTIKNPEYTSTALPPVCNDFNLYKHGTNTIATDTEIINGQLIDLRWDITGANSLAIKSRTTSNPNPAPVDGDLPSGSMNSLSPTESTTYEGLATGVNNLQKQCIAKIKVKQTAGECADTVMMLDRTSGFINNGNNAQNELDAAYSLLDLFTPIHPKVGMGSFGAVDSSATASVPINGKLTSDYGEKATIGDIGPKFPSNASTVNGLNQWVNPNNGRTHETPVALYTTETTKGDKQGYYNFGFNIPSGSDINGIEVVVDGKISGNPAQQSATLLPNGQGTYTAWATNGEATVDDTATPPSCSNVNESIITATANSRESVKIDLSSIPENSTLTSVDVISYDKADMVAGGTYKTFIRLNSVTTDSSTNLTATATGSNTTCSPAKTQSINVVPSIVKDFTTTLEVGVLKTATNNSAVRVGAIRAIVHYIAPPINVDLSWDNGSNFTSNGAGIKKISLTTTDASFTVGDSSDTWGRGTNWVASDFNNGKLLLRLTNNLTTGNTVSIDYVNIRVYYTGSTGLYALAGDITNGNSSVGTFLDQAIKKGAQEIETSPKQRVLVLVSDGGVRDPANPNSNSANANLIQKALTEAATANNSTNKVQIFTINYSDANNNPGGGTGNVNGTTLMSQLASSDTSVATISSAVRTGNTVTITTSAAHNLNLDQTVKISGVSNSVFNSPLGKPFTVTSVPSATTFKYNTASSGNANSTGGTVYYPHFFIPPSGDMSSVFNAIGYNVCPALNAPSASAPPPDPGPAPDAPPPVSIDSWDETILP